MFNGLHLDSEYGQIQYLSTQLRRGENTWSLMNRFRTGQGPCRAYLHKWVLAQSPSCDYGQQQTMNHIVDTCPLTKFECGLNLLHEADDCTLIWWESTATVAHTHTREKIGHIYWVYRDGQSQTVMKTFLKIIVASFFPNLVAVSKTLLQKYSDILKWGAANTG